MTSRCSKRAALIAIAAACWPAAIAQAQTAENLEGTYCLSGVREVGSCLRLTADQKFEYFLAYGAYDEKSEGHWKIDGADLVLDSLPYGKAPKFAFKGFQHAEGQKFDIVVVDKAGNSINGINVRATCDGRSIEVGVTGAGGYKLDCASAPTDVSLGLEMFGLAYQTIQVSDHPGVENAYVFEFDPGDLGNKRFAAMRLRRESGDTLVMTYADTPINELDGKTFTYKRE
jgi:hypothetical protein